MSYLSFYRKYRPQKLDQVIGQEINVRIVAAILREQRIAHAYLFAGPRGSGKTTMARLLAKGLNCEKGITPEPCDECPSCLSIREGRALDVVEMDAASNRGVDEIRELREKVKFTSATMRYKVYILDEVHMLTKEAFNAFLKTLEEPPPRTIFIMATTDRQRVPATIQSRCIRMEFRPIAQKEIEQGILDIASQEGIAIETEAAQRIAFAADGSFRDALSLLEQVAKTTDKKITEKEVNDVLGWLSEHEVQKLIRAMAAHDAAELINLLQRLLDSGKDSAMIVRLMIKSLRENVLQFLQKKAEPYAPFHEMEWWLRELAKCEYWIRTESLSSVLLEITLLQFCQARTGETTGETSIRLKNSAGMTAAMPTKPVQAPEEKAKTDHPEKDSPTEVLKKMIHDQDLSLFLAQDPAHAIPFLLASEHHKNKKTWTFRFSNDQTLAWQLCRLPSYQRRFKQCLKCQNLEIQVLPEKLNPVQLTPEEKVMGWFPGARIV